MCIIKVHSVSKKEDCALRKRLYERHSLFWHYLLLLSILMIFFLAITIVCCVSYTSKLRTLYLQEAEDTLQENCQMLSSDLYTAKASTAIIENNGDYGYISFYDSALPANRYYALAGLRTTFAKQAALLRLPTEYFFVLKNSYCGGARLRTFPNMSGCFTDYIRYSKCSAAMMEEILRNASSLILLPCQRVVIDDAEKECLTMIVPSSTSGSSLLIGFLYEKDTILSMLGYSNLPENTPMQITGADGKVLLSVGSRERKEHYETISFPIFSIGCTATFDIPLTWIGESVHPIVYSIAVLILIAYLIGAALCVLFSKLSVGPFRTMLSAIHPNGVPDNQNELMLFGSFIKDSQEREAVLHQALISALLDRSFAGIPLDHTETEHLDALLPVLAEDCCLGVIRDLHTNGCIDETLDYLRRTMPELTYLKCVSAYEVQLLFPDLPETRRKLVGALKTMNEEFSEDARFVCGISHPFRGAENVFLAARQAYAAVPLDGDLLISVYSTPQGPQSTMAVPAQRLEQFYQALHQRNERAALEILETLRHAPISSDDLKLLFRTMLYFLRDAAANIGLQFESNGMEVSYVPTSRSETVRILSSFTDQLFRRIDESHSTDQDELQKQILAYLSQNYSNNALSLDTLAEQFSVSGRFVIRTLQELTGQSLAKYLLDLRMKAAADALRNTEKNIDQIAAECGYPAQSTFYRVFKKYYSVSPMQFRSGTQ